jgi:2-hydroxychromene-2-carboxylate isomerase
MSSTEQPKSIEFFFDIMCPYAYQTSVWIRDVQEQVGFDISWRFFSLEEINS